MKYLSLFSGGAGGDLGLQHLLNWECKGYVEWDKYCCRVLEQRIKDGLLDDAPIFCGDIREWIRLGYAAAYTGLVDCVAGGFPCQPFSNAGRQLGADDPRNMWPATIECIRVIRPQFAFLENVPAIVAKGYFNTVIGDLAKSGYDCRWRVLSAEELGAPHERKRLWIVAHAQEQRDRRLPERQGRPNQAEIDPCRRHKDVANIGGDGCAEGGLPQREIAQLAQPGVSNQVRDVASARLPERQPNEMERGAQGFAVKQLERPAWWEIEPELDRLVYGFPYRVDRIRAAGNGQIPAVAATAWHLLTADLNISQGDDL